MNAIQLTNTKIRGHELKLFKQTNHLNVGRNFLSQRVEESSNELPEDIPITNANATPRVYRLRILR